MPRANRHIRAGHTYHLTPRGHGGGFPRKSARGRQAWRFALLLAGALAFVWPRGLRAETDDREARATARVREVLADLFPGEEADLSKAEVRAFPGDGYIRFRGVLAGGREHEVQLFLNDEFSFLQWQDTAAASALDDLLNKEQGRRSRLARDGQLPPPEGRKRPLRHHTDQARTGIEAKLARLGLAHLLRQGAAEWRFAEIDEFGIGWSVSVLPLADGSPFQWSKAMARVADSNLAVVSLRVLSPGARPPPLPALPDPPIPEEEIRRRARGEMEKRLGKAYMDRWPGDPWFVKRRLIFRPNPEHGMVGLTSLRERMNMRTEDLLWVYFVDFTFSSPPREGPIRGQMQGPGHLEAYFDAGTGELLYIQR